MPVTSATNASCEADGDEYLLDVARVERPDQHELDERREDAAACEPEQRAQAATARATNGSPSKTCTDVHHVP